MALTNRDLVIVQCLALILGRNSAASSCDCVVRLHERMVVVVYTSSASGNPAVS